MLQLPMKAPAVQWPVKTRELENHHVDSKAWNDFRFRDDDVIVSTYAKSGTTWMQQIVSQLLSGGAETRPLGEISPWLDLRVPSREERLAGLEAQTARRIVKTHLPVDALVFSPRAKYIHIGRDGRDVVWSMYNHHARANDLWYQLLNDTPGRIGPPIERPTTDVREYFLAWLEQDGYPFWPWFENVRTWWEIRHLPNVLLVHYAELKADLPASMRRIADFLDVQVDEDRMPTLVEHCSFDHMKRNAASVAPLCGIIWEGGAGTFINKGTNGRWRDTLMAEDCARYEAAVRRELGRDCARWITGGALLG